MPNKNYVSGRNFEYRVVKWLVNRGYYVVRAYASKGIFDLVATPPRSSKLSGALLIQAKHSRSGKIKISSEEKIRLATASRKYKAKCVIAYNENRKLKWKLINPYYYDRRSIHRQDNISENS
jgi:Holliday junction resolvase